MAGRAWEAEGERVRLRDGRAVLLRPAGPRDAAAVLRVINAVGAERQYILTERFPASVAEERVFLARLDRSRNLMLVAQEPDRAGVVACAAAMQFMSGRYPKCNHVCSIGISILASHRESGLGTAMASRLVEWAALVGYHKVEAEVFAANVRALRLFLGLGFQEEGRRIDHVHLPDGYTDLVMLGKVVGVEAGSGTPSGVVGPGAGN
ncbi:MAG: GNAT family N-acetyltransferase [Acetobacteraceae bacterium]|nr:GNAT family N-acetyltransferase [Acetobacteraceae bacterium]